MTQTDKKHWYIEISIYPGVTIDKVWSHIGDDSFHTSGLELEIVFDNITIETWSYRSGNFKKRWQFDDIKSLHILEIKQQGKTDIHMPVKDNNLLYDVCPKIEVKVQNIPIITDNGKCLGNYLHEDGSVYPANSILGTNGSFYLELSTPIYGWFLENQQAILSNLGIENLNKL